MRPGTCVPPREPTPVRIAAIVHTLNEEHNIAACLARVVGFADDVLVVDMYSDDRTREIAERMGARVLLHERLVEFDAARNWSAQQVDAEWVYYVDADVRVPEPLWEALREQLPRLEPDVVALSLPYKNYFEGRWLTCLYPGYIAPTILRSGCFTWNRGLHEGVQLDGRQVHVPPDREDLAPDHLSYPSFESYIRKSLLRYVPGEMLKLQRAGAQFTWQRAMAEFGRDLAYYYDLAGARRDGGEGLSYALVSAVYRLFSHLALYEQQKNDCAMPRSAAELLEAARQGAEALNAAVQAETARQEVRPDAELYRPGLAPHPLSGRRGYAFFHHPRWDTPEWEAVLLAYARAFGPSDDVSLVLWLDPAQGVAAEEVLARVDRVLRAGGLDPDAVADLLLVPDGLGPQDLPRLYAAVECVVPHRDPRQAERGRLSGTSVLADLGQDTFRAAARSRQAAVAALAR